MMDFSINPEISNDYDSKAESASTIYKWNNNNKEISQYLVSWKIMAPLFALIAMLVGISYFLFAKPHPHHDKVKESTKDKSERGWVIRTNMYIVMALSLVFTVYVLSMDVAALSNKIVYEAFKEWYRKNGSGNPLDELYNLVTAVSVVDFATLAASSILLLFMAIRNCCYCKKGNDTKGKCHLCVTAMPWYFLTFPAVHLAAHSNQVLIGFIHTPYHATAVGILYGIILVTCVILLNFISQLMHAIKFEMNHRNECLCLVPLFSSVLIVIVLIFAYFIAIYFLLPINKAFDDAPNRILAVYQGIIVVFAAFLTYWVIRGHKSPLSHLIRAKDKVANDTKDENWKKCTNKQKEVIISEDLLNYLKVRKVGYGNQEGYGPIN